jgi:HSP20 family molecular chaperone IbpA
MSHAYRNWAILHPGRYDVSQTPAAPGDVEDETTMLAAIHTIADVLTAYELEGDDSVDAIRAFRSILHGFVSLETTGGFALPADIDRSFERFVNDAFPSGPQRNLSVEQDDKAWTLSLDVPGLSRDDITIGIEGPVVRIETKADAKRPLKVAYELPLAIDAAASEAKLENGVLTLKLGKLVSVSQVQQLVIN